MKKKSHATKRPSQKKRAVLAQRITAAGSFPIPLAEPATVHEPVRMHEPSRDNAHEYAPQHERSIFDSQNRAALIQLLAHAVLFILITPLVLARLSDILKYNFLLYHKLIPEPYSAILGGFCLVGLALYSLAATVQLKFGVLSPFSSRPIKRLLTRAPYDVSRNPATLGILLYLAGLSFIMNSLAFFTGTLIFSILALLYLKFVEEPALVSHFGGAYSDYKKKTPFLLPGF